MSDERTEIRTEEATEKITEEGSGGDVIVRTSKGNKMAKTGEKFAEEIMRIARESGLKNFRVFVEGTGEISRSNAPDSISPGMQISLEPFDVAA
jgi:ribosomal protein S11